MQNLKIYQQHFKPITIDGDNFTHVFMQSVKSFHKEMFDTHLEMVDQIPWKMPEPNTINDEYYDILIILASYCKVKLMWRDLLPPDASIIQHGLWVIGKSTNINHFSNIADYFFTHHLEYGRWLRDQNTSNASIMLAIQRDTIYIYIYKLLEPYKNELYKYNLWLENIIKYKYKLDFKKYPTDHQEYYHAISRKFHHKRMLL